jgi:hypothetical protein
MLLVFAAGACASADEPAATDGIEDIDEDLSDIPSQYWPSMIEGLKWMHWFEDNHPEWYFSSRGDESDARSWGSGYNPQADPVFAHNKLEIAGVTPGEVLDLLRSGRSDVYYPNSSAATDCATGAMMQLNLGTSYCWTTFGTEQRMRIVELVDGGDAESVIAWEGGSLGVEVYHRWIMRPTASGTLVITEECERGFMPSVSMYRNRMNPSLHAGHELWLQGMRDMLAGGN